jgi:hypothetical protein
VLPSLLRTEGTRGRDAPPTKGAARLKTDAHSISRAMRESNSYDPFRVPKPHRRKAYAQKIHDLPPERETAGKNRATPKPDNPPKGRNSRQTGRQIVRAAIKAMRRMAG